MTPQQRTSKKTDWLGWLVTAVLLLIVLAVAAMRFGWIDKLRPVHPPPTPTVTIGANKFAVELAADDGSRRMGLSKRLKIHAGTGMLFLYPQVRQPDDMNFWMKDCWTDMDIAFISPDRRIVTMCTMKMEPPDKPDPKKYSPTAPAQFALEVGPGEFARLGIKEGDTVEFSPEVTAAAATAKPEKSGQETE